MQTIVDGSDTTTERLWAMTDANYNVVELIELTNGGWTINDLERYTYDAYGTPTVRDLYYNVRATGTAYDWQHLFTGQRQDLETGLYYYRNRQYHPALGTFITRDPIGYRDCMNLFEYVKGRPTNYTDYSGLWAFGGWGLPDSGGLPPSSSDRCKEWARRQPDPSTWTSQLPDCPCKIKLPKNSPEGNCPPPPDSDVWYPPTTGNSFHPGSSACMRSKPSKGGHGQQCCYDSSGNLITSGEGAGTPDMSVPGFPWLGHFFDDVRSFMDCKAAGMLDTYFKFRPPNKGPKGKSC